MPYVEAVTTAGKTVEIERYYTARYGSRGHPHKPKRVATSEEQKRINEKQAEKKLRRLINANFSPGDYHVVLSYAKARDDPPRTPDEMKDDIAKFLRAMRKEYKAAERELRYIHVAEVGSHGARHHHIVINKTDVEIIQRCWPHGRIHVNPLDQSGNYAKLAAYLIKYSSRMLGTAEKLQGKRWNASRNLDHPIPVKKIITERAWFRSEPKVPKKYAGRYYIDRDSIAMSTDSPEYAGLGFMRFTMVMRC